jgi:DNA polymerase-3 subunit beta
VLVSGRLLAEYARSLPPKPVDLAHDDGRVTLTCGRIRLTLPAMAIDGYPMLPEPPPAVGTVDAAALRGMVAGTAIAAAKAGDASGKAALLGVLVALGPTAIRLTATDGYRAAIGDVPWSPEPGADARAIALATTLLEAVRGIGDGPVRVRLGNGLLALESDDRVVVTRLIAGEYPPIHKVMPERGAGASARFEVTAMAAALKRAELVAPRKAAVRVAFADGVATVTATGEAEVSGEEFDCAYDGPAIEVRAMPGSLLEALAALDTGVAEMHLTTPRKPVMLTRTPVPGEEAAGDAYRHMFMPIRAMGPAAPVTGGDEG